MVVLGAAAVETAATTTTKNAVTMIVALKVEMGHKSQRLMSWSKKAKSNCAS